MALIAIKYERAPAGGGASALRLLDQRRLPFETTWRDVKTPEDAWRDIKDMVVRGAPVRERKGRALIKRGGTLKEAAKQNVVMPLPRLPATPIAYATHRAAQLD